jgi:hypothetical protein
MTILRASVYFSPVAVIRARTWFLNALSSVTPIPHGGAARALAAWLSMTDLTDSANQRPLSS